jgi:hypothetical protein
MFAGFDIPDKCFITFKNEGAPSDEKARNNKYYYNVFTIN